MLHIWVKTMGRRKPLSLQSGKSLSLVFPLPVMSGETAWFTFDICNCMVISAKKHISVAVPVWVTS